MDELASLKHQNRPFISRLEKLPELKKECKNRGLSVSGNKADLVSRLQAAMSTEKPPSDNSVLDEAILDDDDSVLGDDSSPEDSSDINDITLSSPISKIPPASISPVKKTAAVSPVKKTIELSPVKKPEAVKRPAQVASPAKGQTNGANESAAASSPPKKKISINREAVAAPQPLVTETEKTVTSAEEDTEKKVVKVGAIALSAEEKAKLRAQKFGSTASTTATPTPAAAAAAAITVNPFMDERLRKRADRFNNGVSTTVAEHKVVSLTTEDDVKLAKRKERFGIVDEQNKKETRAARFGGSATDTSSTNSSNITTGESTTTVSADPSDKKQIRAARFGGST